MLIVVIFMCLDEPIPVKRKRKTPLIEKTTSFAENVVAKPTQLPIAPNPEPERKQIDLILGCDDEANLLLRLWGWNDFIIFDCFLSSYTLAFLKTEADADTADEFNEDENENDGDGDDGNYESGSQENGM